MINCVDLPPKNSIVLGKPIQSFKMAVLKSKFKKSGPYGILIFLNIGIASLILALLLWIGSNNQPDLTTIIIAAISLFSVQTILLLLFFSYCKVISITEEGISFGNPVIKYLTKSYSWRDFDNFILVHEETEHSEIEAIWLMKNNKLVKRISSGIYLNYEDLKRSLKISRGGFNVISPITQTRAILGLTVRI